MYTKTALTFGLFLLLAACESGAKKTLPREVIPPVEQTTPSPKDSFETGKVIPAVALQNSPADSFALYLPEGYTPGKKYPVILFFDPQGAGVYPVTLYQKLAEGYQVILAGSNSSKNGLPFEHLQTMALQLLQDITERLSVDETKIAFCGHSGGAKVALISGANLAQVSTIIYTGAVAQINPTHPFTLIGFGGTKDMNYTDLVSFEWSLAKSNLPHYFFEWNGAHEFPKAEVFKNALELMLHGTNAKIDRLNISITPEKVTAEQQYKEKYMQAFQVQDLNWWKKEVALLNSKKKSDPMYERLLGFISLACYSLTTRSLQQYDLITAEKMIALYKLADPLNKAIPDLEAELRKKKGN
ncbi:MAG: esterase family protein [Bacteroidia bacterium]|nr:esterase family protein [Bacteroidia bacterium]